MKRRALIATFILIVVFIIIQEVTFRKYLFEHQYALAGCLPNFTAALLFIFGYAASRYPLTMMQTVRVGAAVAGGLILYEIAQIWIPGRVFDWADIGASVVGALVAVGMIYLFGEIEQDDED